MRYTIEVSTVIDASVDAVWTTLRDLPHWSDWDPCIESLRPVEAGSDRPWATASRWVERVRRGPFRPAFHLTVTERREGESFGWAANYLFVRAEHRWILHEREAGTEIVSSETFSGPAPLIVTGRGIFRLVRLRRMPRRSLAALARHVPRRPAN